MGGVSALTYRDPHGKDIPTYEPDQILLPPPSVRDWLPRDNRTHFLSDAANALDLAAICETYTEQPEVIDVWTDVP